MRLGVMFGVAVENAALPKLIEEVRAAAEAGLDSAYFSQLFSWDAVTLAALVAREVPGIDVGTAVTPTHPRHPLALAGQALTAQAASGNRFILGVGPSHPEIIEKAFGHSYDRPARHVREYLTALMPLLRGEEVDHHGEVITAVGRTRVPGAVAPPVLLAALGPVMLRIAGELADGVVTVWTGPRGIGEHIAPAVGRAAAQAERPDPRVVAGVMVSVTHDPDRVRQGVAAAVGAAGRLPSYRAALDRQGMSGVHETVVAGDEDTVERAIRAYADAGATEFVASPVGDEQERARTVAFLSAVRSRR
ncbi:TIGR03564 family F420-dependent LLM class oxidoreductase [Actinoallomurus rhizosphaericola]|uniref:TIGR03564 family F420-dependent LLM class oxidoreductase n=1 Tax=Actinoallomurus rhizosphaericola TaxID=2952536 RepID=UPI0020909335|nr:TIGR03564 family F420-dependent LLM class oxidoreductase [Actinoallomurus rhizosphaericola]MCO5993745.1 TIGR03564 family F420-dependent LLM class oxidoreductase [Actinoallomurus rhizosphaericola]